MSEAAILQRIRLDLGRIPEARLFRNNVGSLIGPDGRRVDFGLARGSGDLVGWRTVLITPAMVGHSMAVFSSVEVKTDTGRPTEHQLNWAATVVQAGGLAGIARNPGQARAILGLPE